MRFEFSTSWLKRFLIDNNYREIASQIEDDWCWKELGRFAKTVSSEVIELVVSELIKSGNGWACYCYCCVVEDRDDVRAVAVGWYHVI